MRAAFRLLLLATALIGPWAASGAPALETAQTAHYVFEWAPGLRGYAEQLMERVEDHHQRIYAELGVTAAGPTHVAILREEGAMLELASARHGSTPPRWADGLAYPAQRAIYLHVAKGPAELDVTLQHEISHVAIGHLAPRGRLPIWFLEGVAIRQSEGFAFERAWLLTQAATTDGLLSLDSLSRGFPRIGGQRVGVAYAQSVHFIGYLVSTFGEPAFQGLLRRVGAGAGLEAAVLAEYQRPLSTIEADWRRSLDIWWGWLPVVFGSTTLWVFGTLLLVMAWRRRRRQRRARLAVLRAEEAGALAGDIEVHPPPNRSPLDPFDGTPPTIH